VTIEAVSWVALHIAKNETLRGELVSGEW